MLLSVLLIYAGGTIGMKKNESGQYAPAPNYLSQVIRNMEEFKEHLMPSFDIIEYSPLLDSSDMDPNDWFVIEF